jgi:predicted RNA binding protein YcfA (HicA-like mRNA interferase family)
VTVVATHQDLETERARLRQRLAELRREKAIVERELARLDAEIVQEPVPPRTVVSHGARPPAQLPSDPERLVAKARQAFGGDPFTTRELTGYLKCPQRDEAAIEKQLRAAIHAGLLTASPRFGAGNFVIEYSLVLAPDEEPIGRQLRLVEPTASDHQDEEDRLAPGEDDGLVRDEDDDLVGDEDGGVSARAPDPIKRKQAATIQRCQSAPLPPVRFTGLAAAQQAWDEQQEREREPEVTFVERGTPISGTGRDVLAGLPPDVRRLVQPAVDAGWTARKCNGSHVQFTHPSDASRVIVISGSPSNRWAIERIRADLRHHGLLSRI